MQTSRVVIHRHIFPHVGNRFLPGSVQAITGPFPFQAAEESLYRGIVSNYLCDSCCRLCRAVSAIADSHDWRTGWIQAIIATPRYGGDAMVSTRRRRSARAGRAPMYSPGRPPVARRDHRQRFWEAIAAGASSEDAGRLASVSPAVGGRWFREGGGMPTIKLAALSGRYLSFSEREEIALLRAKDCPSAWAIAIYTISGVAAKCCDPKWWPRIPSDDCTVARGPTCTKTEAGKACQQRSVADLGRRTPCWAGMYAGWSTGRWAPRAAVERPATRAAHRPSMGESLEP